MDVLLQLEISSPRCLTTCAWRSSLEEILPTRTKSIAVPWKFVVRDDRVDAITPTTAKKDHPCESFIGQNLSQRRSHRSK
jgi:hypothetical protein